VHTSASTLRAGWIVGGRFEYAFEHNWSIKAECFYVRFDGVSASGRLTDGFGGFADVANGIDHVSISLVRVGANYKFGPAVRQGTASQTGRRGRKRGIRKISEPCSADDQDLASRKMSS
jgi:hypothetical protein